jgi:hypothetical protein
MKFTLPPPAIYFPLEQGRYEVAPNLFRFGTDFGNGNPDQQMFQLDREYIRYRENIVHSRAERLSKYYCIDRYSEAENTTIVRFITKRLVAEYPNLFDVQRTEAGTCLHCRLTGEHLHFDKSFRLKTVEFDREPVEPEYVSALDAIASQVPEDIAIISALSARNHWISAIHLCAPNYWAAGDKIGRSYASAHSPVAGMEPVNRAQEQMVAAMIYKGPYVRFTWGLVTDDRLNHHPEAPVDADTATWTGRHFDPALPRLYIRVERQVIWGFPDIGAALFTIRTYLTDCYILKTNSLKRDLLIASVRSMSPDQLRYKGLFRDREAILDWLTDDP